MKKLRIYLDTSVISHLEHKDAPEKMADTLKLWEEIKLGKYNVYISDITINELNECKEPKRSYMLNKLKEIELTVIEGEDSDSVNRLSQEFVQRGILKEKSIDDCMHISAALISECDVIVSWNFKHIVNDKTIEGVKTISASEGFSGIKIYCPSILIGGDDDE